MQTVIITLTYLLRIHVKRKMCSLHAELPSLDIDVWIVSIYLAHHFISQSSDVTLGIHFR